MLNYPVNVNRTERIVRILLGIVLLTASYFTKNLWFLLGLVPLLTDIFGYCPIYSIEKKVIF